MSVVAANFPRQSGRAWPHAPRRAQGTSSSGLDNRLAPALVRRADGQYFAVIWSRGELIAWTWSLEIAPSRSLELSEFGVLSFRSPRFCAVCAGVNKICIAPAGGTGFSAVASSLSCVVLHRIVEAHLAHGRAWFLCHRSIWRSAPPANDRGLVLS